MCVRRLVCLGLIKCHIYSTLRCSENNVFFFYLNSFGLIFLRIPYDNYCGYANDVNLKFLVVFMKETFLEKFQAMISGLEI